MIVLLALYRAKPQGCHKMVVLTALSVLACVLCVLHLLRIGTVRGWCEDRFGRVRCMDVKKEEILESTRVSGI